MSLKTLFILAYAVVLAFLSLIIMMELEIVEKINDIEDSHVKYGNRYSQDYDVEDFDYSDDKEILIPNDVRSIGEQSIESHTQS
jgi:hypothetical protein